MNDRPVKIMLNSLYGRMGVRGGGRRMALETWQNSEAYLVRLIRIKLRNGWRSDDGLDFQIRAIVMYRRQCLQACAHIRVNRPGYIDTDSFFSL